MNEERLKELERMCSEANTGMYGAAFSADCVSKLIAEVRRLRGALEFYEMDLPEFDQD